jgi:dTDP-glucose 4,6-dehydratase
MVTHCTNVFGERQHSEKFIPIIIKKVVCKETVQIHSDKTRTKPSSRFYVYVDNISSAVLFLLEKGSCLDGTDEQGKYNISGEKEITNLELAQKIAQILGRELNYEMVDYCPTRPKHDMRYSISDEKLRNLGWKPKYSFDEGIEKTIKWYTDK